MRARLHTPEISLPPVTRIIREIERGTPPAIIGWREPPPIVQRCAAPTWQATGSQVGTTAFNASPSWPAHAAGHVGILVAVSIRGGSDPGAATLSVANGFTAVTGGSDVTAGGSSVFTRVTLFWARATSGSMSAPTVVNGAGVASDWGARIITFTGCVATGDPTDGASTATNASDNTAFSVPGVTTTGSNRAVLIAGGWSQVVTAGAASNANLTSINERADTTPYVHLLAITAIAPAAGDYGATTSTLSGNANWAGVTVALKPPDDNTSGNLLLLGVG